MASKLLASMARAAQLCGAFLAIAVSVAIGTAIGSGIGNVIADHIAAALEADGE